MRFFISLSQTLTMLDKRIYQIAMTMLPGVGDINAKNLIAYCGSAQAVFEQSKKSLEKIPGIGSHVASKIKEANALKKAEKELEFVTKNQIDVLFYLDSHYPKRLKLCADSPVVLYFKGKGEINSPRAISVVGTRNATAHGKEITNTFIEGLAPYSSTVFSGLAYGIDITAHKACLDFNVPTIGILAHGLDRIYPQMHAKIADQMLAQGGLLTEFPSGTNPDRENFPKRNRIIAGIADATIVVEAAIKGGALITAELAAGYNRDVFAFPGRIDDKFSEGCNKLIFLNKASIVRSAKDLEFYLNWELESKTNLIKFGQALLFVELTKEEEPIAAILKKEGKIHIENLCLQAAIPISKIVAILFNLELKGAVRTHPGKVYEWLAQ